MATDAQETRRKELLEILKKCEAEALASALAALMVYTVFRSELIEKVLADVRENSRIIRHNKRVTTHNNKMARLKVLIGRKRPSRAEQQEILKLAKDLGFKEGELCAP
jgi:hypothetical protein